MMLQNGVVKVGFTGLMAVLMITDAASTENKILSLNNSGEENQEVSVLTPLRVLAGKTENNKYLYPRPVDSIFPPIEKIVHFSVSEEKRASLSASSWLDWLIPSAHAIPADCITAWRADSQLRARTVPDALLGDKCFARRDRPRINPIHRLFYPIDWVGSANERFVDLAEDALKKAMRKFRDMGLPSQNIDVVFTPDQLYASPAYALGATGASPRLSKPSVCQILLYEKSWNTTSDKYFLHTVAHEAFHCVQFWLSAAKYSAAGSSWWVEGSAEFFANVVYPCENGEQPSVDNFDHVAGNTSLLLMDYDNVVFFQFLANEIGNRGVIDFIGTMPEAGGLKRQLNALARYPSIAELFHRFGRQYYNKKIADSCPGMNVDIDPQVETTEILQGDEEIVLFPTPFQLVAHELVFEAGHYAIETESVPVEINDRSAKRGRGDSKSALPSSSWEKLPEEVDVACRDRLKLLTLFTSAENNISLLEGTPIDLRLKVSRKGYQAGVQSDERGVDQCLVGSWALEPESLEAMGRWMASYLDKRYRKAPGVRSHSEYLGFRGGMKGTVTAGGKIYSQVKGLEQKMVSDQSHKLLKRRLPVKMETIVTIDSNSCADYSADGGELVVWNLQSKDAVKTRLVTSAKGKRIVSEKAVNLNMSEEKLAEIIGKLPGKLPGMAQTKVRAPGYDIHPEMLRFTYQCSDDLLEIDGPLTTREGAPPLRFRKRNDDDKVEKGR